MTTIGAAIITVGLNPVVVYALPTPVSSSLILQADSDAGGGVITNIDSDSQLSTVNPLSASVSALATSGEASVLSQAKGTATWIDSSQGVVNLTDIGWKTVGVNSGSAALFNGLDWSYEFISDATGFFTLDYDISTSGMDTFGLNGFNFGWSGIEGGAFFSSVTSGTLQRVITAGQTYVINIKNGANISGALDTREAFMDGTFKWKIDTATATVPESDTILGLLAFSVFSVSSLVNYKQKAVRSIASIK
ncbi:hypothetical protein ACEYW6_31505 [Nostoc sp. UIC 10607]|uniref:hypothetical protein n=1 Tax=Nostoc sp. UIC 10607 TaxID=3045935 RepID=UPI0039A333D3